MAAVKIDPMKLPGPWADGFVVERHHTLTSEFPGHDCSACPADGSRARLAWMSGRC
jgi:hypothetical protein